MGNAEHLQLDRQDDARLNFLGRHARRFHDDLDLRRGHVREGVDRQRAKCRYAKSHEHKGEDPDQQALGQSEFDDAFEHD